MKASADRDPRAALARLVESGARQAGAPVVSVYLNTRWADEHQRERTRVFLKNEVRRARATAEPELVDDLDWIEAQGQRIVQQADHADVGGVALFASGRRGVREVVPVRVPFEDAFVVADHARLSPLATRLDQPAAVVLFVDGERARLIPLRADGAGDEVVLEHEVLGRHRRGGWALLAQSRYQRHVEAHRSQHFEAVVDALAQLVDEEGIERIVLAGEGRTLSVFRRRLPAPLAARVQASMSAARYEQASALVERAAARLAEADQEAEARSVESVLVEDAKGGRAVAGVAATVDAVIRGAVHRLYLLRSFDLTGHRCDACGTLSVTATARCLACGGAVSDVPLADALVDRVIAAHGSVDIVDSHEALARAGGVAARLRYPV